MKKPITLDMTKILKAEEQKLQFLTSHQRGRLECLIKESSRSLKKHFKAKDSWPINLDSEAATIVADALQIDIHFYTQLAILKRLGKGFIIDSTKSPRMLKKDN